MNEEARQSIIEELLAEGLTLEQIEQFMEILTMEKKTPGIVGDVEYYGEMTDVRRPTGRGYGGVYREAHPLEFIGAGLQSAAGHYGRWRAREKQDRILDEIRKRRMGPAGLGGGVAPQRPPNIPTSPPATTYPLKPKRGTPYEDWEPYIGPQPLPRGYR